MDVTTFQVTTGVPLQVTAPALTSILDDLKDIATQIGQYAVVFAAVIIVFLVVFLILLLYIAFR